MKKTNRKHLKNSQRLIFNYKIIFKNIIILLFLFFLFNLLSSNIFAERELKTREITVVQGQTLWGIAQHIKEKNNDLNLQNIIYEIKDINNLGDSLIYGGQVIKIPVY